MNEIFEFWSSAGWYASPLLAVSILCWFWLINLYMKLTQSEFSTSRYEHEMTERLIQGESHQSIINWMTGEKGIVPGIIGYVFNTSDRSKSAIEGRYLEAAESEVRAIKKEFSVLGALIKAAPLLGLLGTVAGMIETFTALGGVTDMETVTSGISKALLTTQLGLLIALPGVFGLVYLKRKFERLVLELSRLQFHINALCPEDS
jgi:biopolymer transport protein ExbB